MYVVHKNQLLHYVSSLISTHVCDNGLITIADYWQDTFPLGSVFGMILLIFCFTSCEQDVFI